MRALRAGAAALACLGVLAFVSCTGETGLLTAMKQYAAGVVPDFKAVANSTSQVTLTWTVPSSSVPAGLIITRKAGSTYPTSKTDGTQLSGVVITNGSFVDALGLAANTRYSYSAWSYSMQDGQQVLSASSAQDWADTTVGVNISLPLLGAYCGQVYSGMGYGFQVAFPFLISGGSTNGILKVDTTSSVQGKPVASANLSFYANNFSSMTQRSITIGQISANWSAWSDTNLWTYSMPPSLGLTATSSLFDSYSVYAPVSVDITAIVQSWASGTTNNGLSLIDTTGLNDYISGTSSGTGSPSLKVSYWYEYPF